MRMVYLCGSKSSCQEAFVLRICAPDEQRPRLYDETLICWKDQDCLRLRSTAQRIEETKHFERFECLVTSHIVESTSLPDLITGVLKTGAELRIYEGINNVQVIVRILTASYIPSRL